MAEQSVPFQPLRFDVVTLFPEMFAALTESGVTSRAFNKGLVEFHPCNPRQFTMDRHQSVDARPYGGGPGMLMMYAPLKASVAQIQQQVQQSGIEKSHVIYLSPQGQPLTQKRVEQLAELPAITLVCGRYEGVDERFIQKYVDEEIAIGDFVVSGGELPAMMLMDAVIRLMPGVLGHQQSAVEDSFTDGLLDCPHYTRPEEVEGMTVPKVLLAGHHAKIDQWRMEQKILRTQQRRPDLYQQWLARSKKES